MYVKSIKTKEVRVTAHASLTQCLPEFHRRKGSALGGGDSLPSVTSWGGGSHPSPTVSACPYNPKGPQANYTRTWR